VLSLGWFIAGPFIYASAAVCVCGAAYKVIRLLMMPRPFRWDLYPLPHRGPAGSKYQKVDFGKQKAESFPLHELKEMAEEILFIKRLFTNNLRMWLGSYAMHCGLYIGVLWIALLIIGAIIQISGIALNPAVIRSVNFATVAAGAAALVFGLAGSLYLFANRLIDPDLRTMSDAASFVNLSLMIAMFAAGLAAWLGADRSFSGLQNLTAGLITLKPPAPHHPLITIELFFFGLFLIYLPFSRMLHFAAKYFFYHNIMWDDEAMRPGSRLEQERLKELSYRPQWSASHITAGGSWFDQVTGEKPQGDKKS